MWPNRGSREPGSSTSPEQPDAAGPDAKADPAEAKTELQGPPVPPVVSPRPPIGEAPEEARRDRRTIWLAAVTVVALLAAGGAGYAISEIEDTKDQNRQDDQAVNALRTDLDGLQQELGGRLDRVEADVGQAATSAQQEKLQEDLDALDKRVAKLDKQDDGGAADDLQTRVDDLEQRIQDLEDDSNK